MTFITDFADQGVILPLVIAVGIALWLRDWRRGAAAWVLVVSATSAVMLVLKPVFLGCSLSLGALDLRSPSGHVAAATVVGGGLAALLLRRRGMMLALALLAGVIVAVSRLALGRHSIPEVALGAVVGLAGAWCLRGFAGEPPPGFGAGRIAAVAIAVALVFHGLHLPAEAEIRFTALRLARVLSVCQPAVSRL